MAGTSPSIAPQAACHRFFFALKPDVATAQATHDFALAELGTRGLLRMDAHHVTLGLTEDHARADPALIAALRRAGDSLAAPAFELHLDRLVTTACTVSLRPSRPPPALAALQSAISGAMAREGVAMRAGWRFDPHQTLAYRKGAPQERILTGFRWSVDAVMLVHSHVGLHRHETIGQWPLALAAGSIEGPKTG